MCNRGRLNFKKYLYGQLCKKRRHEEMRKKQAELSRTRTRWQQTTAGASLLGLIVCAILTSHALLMHFHTLSQTAPSPTPTQSYLYYVLKTPAGFVLARAHSGLNAHPTHTPQRQPSSRHAFALSPNPTLP